jgi:phospholipid-binding lipoprotein MlaA
LQISPLLKFLASVCLLLLSEFADPKRRAIVAPTRFARSLLASAALILITIALISIRVPFANAQPSDLDISGAKDAAAAVNPEESDYDPWEPFNDKMFTINHDYLDRYVMKPVATAWADVLPAKVRHALGNAYSNLEMPRRFVNFVAQGRPNEASGEMTRFLFNTTIGVAGFFDVAGAMGLKGDDADTGQTLGSYGVGPGPYLVLPVLPPLTVRDAIGFGADGFMDPLGYFIPFVASVGRTAGKMINDRAENLKLFQDVEDTSLDLYGAVRNGYLQRRKKSVQDAIEARHLEMGNPPPQYSVSQKEPNGERSAAPDQASESQKTAEAPAAEQLGAGFTCDENDDICVENLPASAPYAYRGGHFSRYQ